MTARQLMQICGLTAYPPLQGDEPDQEPQDPDKAFMEELCAIDLAKLGEKPSDLLLEFPDPRAAIERAAKLRWVVGQAIAKVEPAALTSTPVTAAGFETALLWGLGEFLVKRAKEEIDLARRQALEDIRREAVELAVKAASVVVRKSLDDREHRRIASEVVSEIGTGSLA